MHVHKESEKWNITMKKLGVKYEKNLEKRVTRILIPNQKFRKR